MNTMKGDGINQIYAK